MSSTEFQSQWMCMHILLTLIIFINRSECSGILSMEENEINVIDIISALSENAHRQSSGSNVREIEKLIEMPNVNAQVKPHISIGTSVEENDGPQMIIVLRADTYNLTVILKPTWDLLTTSYKEPLHQKRKGKLASLPCEWQGVVQGLEDRSLVALSICPVIRGIIDVDGAELSVDASLGSTTPEEFHLISTNSRLQPTEKWGVREQIDRSHGQATGYKRPHMEDRSSTVRGRARNRRDTSVKKHGSLWTDKHTRFVEMVLVADNSYYKSFGEDVYDRLRTTVNIVNARFRDLGIVVALTDIEVWENRDHIKVSSDGEDTLSSFSSYRLKLLRNKPGVQNDHTVLVTSVDYDWSLVGYWFEELTVGYAYLNGICRNNISVSTVRDKKNSDIVVFSRIMAHELGHSLGMMHDDEDRKSDCCLESSCIMSASSSFNKVRKIGWSSCSKEVVEKNLNSLDYECLRNVPSNFYQKTCGDGIVDSGEECDCGPQRFCDNPCCNAVTCRWTANATCAHGPCCNLETCQLHVVGKPCREKIGDCDVPEFCSGTSEYCPTDDHVRDGTPCEGKKGYCYKGTCGNPDGKCKMIWGQTATAAYHSCPESNERGDMHGNCGWASKIGHTFKKCTKTSSPCGTLQCNIGEDVSVPLVNYYRYGWMDETRSQYCRHLVGSENTPESVWLAPNGSPCGQNGEGMCIDQECNYIKPESTDIVNLLIFLAVIITILTFICCSWQKLRHWWEWRGYHSVLGHCPKCANCINVCCCPFMTKITERFVTVCHKKETKLSGPDEVEATVVCPMLDLNEKSISSWGLPNERLFTEVVQITPKNSPDINRKATMKLNSSLQGRNLVKDVDVIPIYQQESISVDLCSSSSSSSPSSACSSDDPNAHQPVMSQMPMTCPIGTLSKCNNDYDKSQCCKDHNQQPRTFGGEKTIILARKPQSGDGIPLPNDMNSPYSISMSADIQQLPGETLPVTSKLHSRDGKIQKTRLSNLQHIGGSEISHTKSVIPPPPLFPPPPPPVNSIQKSLNLQQIGSSATNTTRLASSSPQQLANSIQESLNLHQPGLVHASLPPTVNSIQNTPILQQTGGTAISVTRPAPLPPHPPANSIQKPPNLQQTGGSSINVTRPAPPPPHLPSNSIQNPPNLLQTEGTAVSVTRPAPPPPHPPASSIQKPPNSQQTGESSISVTRPAPPLPHPPANSVQNPPNLQQTGESTISVSRSAPPPPDPPAN